MKNSLIQIPQPSHTLSRRGLLVGSAITGLAGALGMSAVTEPATAASTNDIKILNNALYYEHQAIWAYEFAAGKLSSSKVGSAVKALALRNQADHKAHRDALASLVKSMGGKPVGSAKTYDLSAYIQKGEGNLDSDVNIAKLALALETDAAIAYTTEIAQLKNPKLITAGATIGSDEAAHATAIRAAFVSLGVDIPYVPAAFVGASTRDAWIVKV
jgi:rubrerythrin